MTRNMKPEKLVERSKKKLQSLKSNNLMLNIKTKKKFKKYNAKKKNPSQLGVT